MNVLHPILALVLCVCAGCASSPAPPKHASAAPPAEPSTWSLPPEPTPSLAIPFAHEPMPGVVTGGVPTQEDLVQARLRGFSTVVSLLPEQDTWAEANATRSIGMRFVSIPIADARALTKENAQRLGEVLADPDAKPLILHCASGNRAGALLALWAYFVDGQEVDAALALGERAGMKGLLLDVRTKLRHDSGLPP